MLFADWIGIVFIIFPSKLAVTILFKAESIAQILSLDRANEVGAAKPLSINGFLLSTLYLVTWPWKELVTQQLASDGLIAILERLSANSNLGSISMRLP